MKIKNRIISFNHQIKKRYRIYKKLECGILLKGSEVKSMRLNKVSIINTYVIFKNMKMLLIGLRIPLYFYASLFNHEIMYSRVLLAHKSEIIKFYNDYIQKGISIKPIMIILKKNLIKIIIASVQKKKFFMLKKIKKKYYTRLNIKRIIK